MYPDVEVTFSIPRLNNVPITLFELDVQLLTVSNELKA